MRFALEVREGREQTAGFAQALTASIEAHGGELAQTPAAADMVLAVGGDGTMLAAVSAALATDIPVLGFNLGTIGFLAEAEPDDLDDVVARLVSGDYSVTERMTVSATVAARTSSGVNDVVVEKVDSQRLVSLDVTIDGSPFVTYRADGLVVSTPTGSTAYGFSAGGPLVDPSVPALVLTPVAAHSLFDRPLVLPAESVIEVEVGRDRPVKVSVDKNDLGVLGSGGEVTIRRGDRPARFVTLGGRSFPTLVVDKFALR